MPPPAYCHSGGGKAESGDRRDGEPADAGCGPTRRSIFSPKYELYNARVDTLYSADDCYTPAGKNLYERLRAAETQEEANKIYKQRDSLEKSRRLYSPRMMALQDYFAACLAEEKSWRLREAAHKPSVSGLSFCVSSWMIPIIRTV